MTPTLKKIALLLALSSLSLGCGEDSPDEVPQPDTAAPIDSAAVPVDTPATEDTPLLPPDPFEASGFPVSVDEAGVLTLGPLRSYAGGKGAYAAPVAHRGSEPEVGFLLGFYTFAETAGQWTTEAFTAFDNEELTTAGSTKATIEVVGDHTVQLTITAPEGSNRVSMAFACDEDDRFLGFGAQTPAMEHRGARIPIWVAEQGIGKDPALPEDEMDMVFKGHEYDSYFPVPFFISPKKGYGLLVEGTTRTVFELCSKPQDAWRVETWSGELKLTLFRGPEPTEVLRRATEWMGRPEMPPDWSLLPWIAVKGGTDVVQAKAIALRDAKIPASAIWSEDWLGESINPITGNNLKYHWEWDEEHYPDLKGLTDQLHAMDLRFLGYFNPFILEHFDEWDISHESGYLPQTPEGTPYEFPVLTYMGSVVDVTSPSAREWLLGYMQKGVELGLDGWMADFAEWVPFDARFADGRTGDVVSSDYPRLWQEVNAQACSGECLFFVRSGFTGSAALARAVWAGDQNTDFGDDDGLPTAVRIGVGLGLAGVAFYGSDIAGYTSSVSPPSTKELYYRWTTFGAYTPIMRTHEGNLGEANWNYDEDAETLAHFRAYAEVHSRLFPFWKALLFEATQTGLPPMRHPALHYPQDDAMISADSIYLLGPQVLVAPVVEEGATERTLTLPPGTWVDLRDDQRHARSDTAALVVPAALDSIPVFAAPGALIPRLPTPPITPSEATTLLATHVEVVAVLGSSGEMMLADGTTFVLTSSEPSDPGALALPECAGDTDRGCTTLASPTRRTYRLEGGTLTADHFAFAVEGDPIEGRKVDVVVVFEKTL